MRKRKFVGGIFALCLALSMAGCGKGSEEKQAADYYQNELGLDKEDAEYLAHELYGEDGEESGVTGEGPKETVVEPLPDLVNSEWYEQKVRFLDMVFTMDMHLTEEDIRKIVAGSAYNVELSEDFDENGDVYLDGIMLDGKKVVYFEKCSRSDFAIFGLFEDGDYYTCRMSPDDYKPVIDALGFKTRNDVLAYLAENGFVEVEEEQSPMNNTTSWYTLDFGVDVRGVVNDKDMIADVPHYYSKGMQSITFFTVHKLKENNQEIAIDFDYKLYKKEDNQEIDLDYKKKHYSGCHLNLYQYVCIEFHTDGTISSTTCWEPKYWLILGEEK